jgi:hypothetical protein
MKISPTDIDWTVIVTESLPNCPSIKAGWEKIATQSKWGEWRSESKLRGKDVSTFIVPPGSEPLKKGDKYIVSIGNFMKIHCQVIESSSPETSEVKEDEMVFDATGISMGGLIKARFRFKVFRGEDGTVMARAHEKIMALPFLIPSKKILEGEHRHTFKDLNKSFHTS